MNQPLEKIIIIGDAGRGKSTLALALSKKLGIPHYSTDDFFYEVKFSKQRSREDALALALQKFSTNTWIVEGTTQWLLQPGMEKADLILYLRHPSLLLQWYVLIKRYFVRKEETFTQLLGLMKHVLYKRYGLGYKKGSATHAEIISPFKDKVVTLSSFEDINSFVQRLDKYSK